MSPTFKVRLQLASGILFSVLILLGVALRFFHLSEAPYGMDSDQARVLYSGAQAIEHSNYRVYADEATRFEALSTYLFATSEKWWGDARVLSTFLSLLDLILLVALLRRSKLSWDYCIGGVALLACSPFAIFYSRVAGPCVGASTILLVFLLLKNRGGQAAALTVGLFYYSILRLVWVYEVLAALVRRDRNRFLFALIPLTLLIGVSALFHDFTSETKFRGLYNFNFGPAEMVTRIFEGLGLWVWSPSDRMSVPTDDFIMDPVSQGFASLLGSAPAMGLGFSLLLILAGIQFGQDLYLQIRSRGVREAITMLPAEIKFFLFAFAALMLSPTYSHGIFLVPIIVFFCLFSFQAVTVRHLGVYFAVSGAILISCLTGVIQSTRMIQALHEPGQFDQVFGDRLRLIFEKRVSRESDGPTYFFSATQFYQARYWASRLPGKVNVLPAMDPAIAIENMKLSASPGQPMFVYFDVQEFHENWMKTDGAKATFAQLKDAEALLTDRAIIVKTEEISELGQAVARRYEVRWR